VRNVVLLCASVALAAAISAGVAGAASTKSGSSVTLHLVEKDATFKFVDNPPAGKNVPPSAGDQFAFTSDLLEKGKRVGTLDATCTVTKGGKHAWSTCTGVMALGSGQLAAIALVPLADNARQPDISIVGGTGAYTGATGTLRSVSRGPNSPFSDDTIHLILPS